MAKHFKQDSRIPETFAVYGNDVDQMEKEINDFLASIGHEVEETREYVEEYFSRYPDKEYFN